MSDYPWPNDEVPTFAATFESWCQGCEDHIELGDIILHDDELGWIHTECAE